MLGGGERTTNFVGLAVFLAIFGAIIVRQIVGRGPPVWAILGVGGVATVAALVVTPRDAGSALLAGIPVLAFLAALFAFAGALERAGALDHLARWMVRTARTPADLPWFVFVGFGIASAFIVNDALIIVAIPIMFSISRRINLDPKPLLLTAAFAVTVGSTLTPLGNPQNLLISISSGLATPLLTFLRYLLLPVGVGLLLGGLYLRWTFRKDLAPASVALERARGPPLSLLPRGGWGPRLARHPVLVLFPLTIGVMLGFGLSTLFLGTPSVAVWIPAVAGALLLFAVSPGRGAIVRSIDLRILTLFAGLFVVVAGALSAGVIGLVEAGLPITGPAHAAYGTLGIFGTSLIGAQLFSNVPWVGLQIPVLAHLGYNGSTPLAWIALAAGSTLAGNVTLLGAASNLILVERAEDRGVHIGLGEFVRYALPLAALTCAIAVAALLVGL